MTSNNWETLGENIRDIVQSAVDSQDYRKLNQTINTALNVAAQEMQNGICVQRWEEESWGIG